MPGGYGTGGDGGIEIGKDVGCEHVASDASGLNGGVLLGQYDGGVKIGEDVGGEHVLGDGSGQDGFGEVRQICYLGGKGVGSGGDALVGLEVQPLPGVEAKKVNY